MLIESLKKIARLLQSNNIPYMIIGGQAALVYREPRFTNDIDITLGVNTDSLQTLLDITSLIGLRALVADPKEFADQTMVLPMIDDASGIRCDFIFSSTEYEKDALTRVNRLLIDDTEVCYCSVEDLIILKVFSGRLKDLDDVSNILMSNKNIDRDLIMKKLIELGSALNIDLAGRFISIESGVKPNNSKLF